MVEIRFKHDQMKVSPDGVANNRGDPPRLFGARGDPSSGGKRAPTMVSNAVPKRYPLLPIKNRDRLSALASLRATVGSAAICRPIGNNNNNNSERECVRLDDSPDVSLADFSCEGVSRGREGFHRAPTIKIAASLRATVGSAAICQNDSVRVDCFVLLRRPRNDGQYVRVDCFVLLRRPRTDDQNSSVIATLRHERGSNLLAIWEPIIIR